MSRMFYLYALSCLLALPALASAAQWTVVPQIALGADSDSNRRLQRDPHASDSAVLGGALLLARVTETGTLALTPRATLSRYSGEDALDSDDWGVNAMWRYSRERLQFEFSAGMSDDSTLVTEFGETGFVEGNTRRRSNSAGVSLTQYLATRHRLQYQLNATDIDYQRTAGTGLVGYRYPSAGLMYSFDVSPRLEGTLSLSAARLDAPESALRSDTRGAQAGFRWRISQRFDLEARAGQSFTNARGNQDSEQSYHAALSWHDELSRLELSVGRDVEPSGRGVLVNADDLRVAYWRELTERLSLDSWLRVSQREDLSFGLRGNEYRYGAASLVLSLKLSERWTLGLAGVYSRQEYALIGQADDGRRIGLSLSWRPLQQ